jgi:RimJ/RimL family protein N-acetyltransferase
MTVSFLPVKKEHIPLWEQWVQLPHVKESWFIEGYETPDVIYEKIAGNGYDHSFIIDIDDCPVGYIVCCDLYAYRTICPSPKGLFANEEPGTFCMDLFIADENYLNKGYGTEIVRSFIQYIFGHYPAEKILIDPDIANQRAIRCYEKAGFTFFKKAFDGIADSYVMAVTRAQLS